VTWSWLSLTITASCSGLHSAFRVSQVDHGLKWDLAKVSDLRETGSGNTAEGAAQQVSPWSREMSDMADKANDRYRLLGGPGSPFP